MRTSLYNPTMFAMTTSVLKAPKKEKSISKHSQMDIFQLGRRTSSIQISPEFKDEEPTPKV